MRFQQWKATQDRSAVGVDGSWYPDARFTRIVMVKSSMPEPATLQDAISNALHVLNTVTVPPGGQAGKDI